MATGLWDTVLSLSATGRSNPILLRLLPSPLSHRDSFEPYLLWRISSSPRSLSSFPTSLPPSLLPSFVCVLARRVIVPYLAAAGRADGRDKDAVTIPFSIPHLMKIRSSREYYIRTSSCLFGF